MGFEQLQEQGLSIEEEHLFYYSDGDGEGSFPHKVVQHFRRNISRYCMALFILQLVGFVMLSIFLSIGTYTYSTEYYTGIYDCDNYTYTDFHSDEYYSRDNKDDWIRSSCRVFLTDFARCTISIENMASVCYYDNCLYNVNIPCYYRKGTTIGEACEDVNHNPNSSYYQCVGEVKTQVYSVVMLVFLLSNVAFLFANAVIALAESYIFKHIFEKCISQ